MRAEEVRDLRSAVYYSRNVDKYTRYRIGWSVCGIQVVSREFHTKQQGKEEESADSASWYFWYLRYVLPSNWREIEIDDVCCSFNYFHIKLWAFYFCVSERQLLNEVKVRYTLDRKLPTYNWS